MSTPPEDLPQRSLSPHLALIGVQAFFGSLPVVGKVVLAVIPSLALVGFRVGITAAVLYFVQRSRGSLRLVRKRDYGHLAVLSMLGAVLNQLLFILGLARTRASNTSLLAVTIPIFAITIGALAGTEKLRAIRLAGIAAATAGVVLFIDPFSISFTSETTAGDILIILNSAAYGAYLALSKDVITRNGAIRSMAWLFIFASVICVPVGALSLTTIDIGAVSARIWIMIVYMGVIATAAPYLLNAWALARVDPSTVAVYIYLQPLLGFLLAAIFLGEMPGMRFALAAILIFAGVFLVTRRPRE